MNEFDDMVRKLEDEKIGWIGVDLDGTLAVFDGWKGVNHIGKPVPIMVRRVLAWLNEGKKVKIFTARVSCPGFDVNTVHDWLETNGLPKLEVTNVKDYAMMHMYDDRCTQVQRNTGGLFGVLDE